MSVRPSVLIERHMSKKILVTLKIWQEITDTLHEDRYKFFIIIHSVVVRMKNISGANFTGNHKTHFEFNNIFRNSYLSGWPCVVIIFYNKTIQQNQTVSSWSCSQAVSKSVWHIPLLCVQWKTPDDGQRNCPKHIVFYSKNKFEKLVHLVFLFLILFASCQQICMTYTIAVCTVKNSWWWTEELSETYSVVFQK
jgi:hypothetical protein